MKTSRILTLATLILVSAFASLQAADKGGGAKEKAKPYPLKTCAVSGEKLGEMGDPHVFVHEGQEVKLCCKSCLKDFNKDSAKIMKKIAKASKKSGK